MEQTDVIVVGAGLAGLTAGASAAGQGARVVVVEGQRPGGRARTTRRGDVAWNQGPHALYLGGEASRVLAGLGVHPTGAAPLVAEGRLEAGGRLHAIPGGVASLARSTALRPRSRLQLGRVLAGLGRIAPAAVRGRSTDAWLDDLGLHDDARGVVAALVRVGAYAADHGRLPAEVALGQLRLAARHGVRYLDDGFGQLVAALQRVAAAGGATLVDHDPVVGVAATPGGWQVTAAGGRVWSARSVVLAAGSPAACTRLVPAAAAAWASTGPDARAACLGVVARRRPDPPVVFGVDEPLYLSMHGPPARLAPEGLVLVEVMRYRTTAEVGDPRRDRAQLEALLARTGVRPDDVVDARYLHDMPAVRGVPDPAVGLAGRPPVAVEGADGLFVAGDWVGPAGWLADASMASGEAAGLLAAAAAHAGPGQRRAARDPARPWHDDGIAVRTLTDTGRLDTFEAERARLTGLAYRMLGTLSDAEDVVQEAWIRWQRDGRAPAAGPVENPAAWLTTAVSRLALDRLRARRRDRATYVGPWLPEPVVVAERADAGDAGDPADRAVRTESLSLGFLHLLERLSPRERVAFVLTEVFAESHERAGQAVGATATASRQLAHRARRKLADAAPPDALGSAALGPVVEAFVAACATGAVDDLLRVLAPDVVLVSDGGAEQHAARRPVVGPARVARLLAFVAKRVPRGTVAHPMAVNGAPAVVLRWFDVPVAVVAVEAGPAGVHRVRLVVAPAKLRRLDAVTALV